MRLAYIPPFSLLETTFQTDYQLMLPQLVGQDERYDYVYSQHCKNPNTFVILDNGAAEGEQVSDEELVDRAREFGVSEVVLPDVMEDSYGTLEQTTTFWNEYGHLGLWKSCRTMFVAQGANYEEFQACIKWAIFQDWIDTIAIPRHAVVTCGRSGARTALAHYVIAHSEKTVHFLGGAPTEPRELGVLAKEFFGVSQVRGMDTSMPFNYAWWGELMLNGQSGCKRPENYFTLGVDEFNVECLLHNLETMKRWLKGE